MIDRVRGLAGFLVVLSGLLFASVLVAQPPAEAVRLASEAFGERLEIEVRDLPRDRAEDAIRAAITEIHEIEVLTRPDGAATDGLGALNRAPAETAVVIDRRLLALLSRAVDFCVWSQGAHGPLGGQLYDLWGLHRPVTSHPQPRDLARGSASAHCDRILLDAKAGTAELAQGTRADLWGFAEGYAVDRAVAVLEDRGATNLWVEVGRIDRAVGDGPAGRGWRVTLPVVEGFTQPLDEVWLHDRALVMANVDDRRLDIAGDSYPPFIDQRSGEPAGGIQATFASTELALDSQGVATAMLITGNRLGTSLLGALRPLPSVLWMIGDGSGAPLLAAYQWSKLKTR
ncbi:MAG: FAD:protein FMN transferase [Acidobacteria bacterium]|nr:FAD:protein FMN transferase [Acidobacteriota bacterium]